MLCPILNNNNSIEGFTTTDFENEIKSIQHADDMTLTLKNIYSNILELPDKKFMRDINHLIYNFVWN